MIRYRPDIDGLRAIAVMAVVAFHANVRGFSGGFVGVDVFFVISGFLISSLLLDELAASKLDIVDFYRRRVMRIFPALLLMLTATLAFGWVLFPPLDYQALGASVMSAAGFVSNHYFLDDVGYFQTAAEVKPLLHTWSLAVEEQYYLLFPLYLLLLRRLSPGARKLATGALWAASFGLSVYCVGKDPRFAFYTLPTRAWELLSGVLLALGVARPPRSRAEARIAAIIGLALIAGAVCGDHADMPFPGFAALPPVLGSALILWAGLSPAFASLGWLGARPLVAIGLISYPLYLWHFPAIGLVRYLSLGDPGTPAIAGALGVSTLLAGLTYRFVERPLRNAGRAFGARAVLCSGLGAMGTVGAAALAVYLSGGFAFRVAADRMALADGLTDRSEAAEACMNKSPTQPDHAELCSFGAAGAPVEALLWGDSFAQAALPGVEAAAERRGRRFLFVGRHGCEPQTGAAPALDVERKCTAFSRAALDFALAHPEWREVVLSLRWPAASSGSAEGFTRRLEELVQVLSRAGRTVWITGPLPVAALNAPRALYVQSLGFAAGRKVASTRAEFDADFGWTDSVVRRLEQTPDVHVLSSAAHFCDAHLCKVIENGRPLYFDDAHLSTAGARLLEPDFGAAFP